MKYILILCFSCICHQILAQSAESDSLLILLDAHPQADTLRCRLLAEYIDIEPKLSVWVPYNEELIHIAEQQLQEQRNSQEHIWAFKKWLATGLCNRGYAYRKQGRDKESLENYMTSLKISETIGDSLSIALVYTNLGSYYNTKNEYAIAAENHLKAYYIYRHYDTEMMKLNTVIGSLAYTYERLNDFERSLHFQTEAKKLAEQIGGQDALANVLTNMAALYDKKGDFPKALESVIKAIRIREGLDDLSARGMSYVVLGQLLAENGDLPNGIMYIKRAIRYFLQNDDNYKAGMATTTLVIHEMMEVKTMTDTIEQDKALNRIISSLNKAYTWIDAAGSKEGKGRYFARLADVYLLKSKLHRNQKAFFIAKAQEYYQKSLVFFALINDRYYSANVCGELSHIYLNSGSLVQAEKVALQGLGLAQLNGLETQVIGNANVLRQVYQKQGQYQKALSMAEIELLAQQRVYSNETKTHVIQTTYQYESEKKEAEINSLEQQNQIATLKAQRRNVLIYGLFLFIIVVGLLAYFLFARYKTKKQNELLRVELEQTQKTIIAERKAAESELKALKSQMNPHFIFNALNSIQEQFMYGDKFKANDQMGNFTYLTRKILDVSGKKLITLATEIEILDKYLSLERMRFGDEFVYNISLSDRLDEDYNQIPPMLIQPFAENSIKHGLLHRVGAKRLDIHFDLDEAEAYLICTITDNGVGRGKSALIKAKNQNQHQSFSTQSIAERLAILSTDPSKELVQYTDLYDEQGESSGTQVMVYVPL